MIMRPFILALCAAATPAIADPAQMSAPSCPYIIEDGDTIVVAETGEKIRLMGFDTPEIGKHAWCEAELRLGTLASKRLGDLLCTPGAGVGIARNVAKPVDRYGRTLAVVGVAGRDVAEVMISEGWARPYNGARRKGWCSRDSRDDLVPAAGAAENTEHE